MGFSDYISKPVKIKVLEEALRKYIPQEKQISKENIKEELPVLLIWGDDSEAVKAEKERLENIYKCVCVVGEKARDKYLEKHDVNAVMRV